VEPHPDVASGGPFDQGVGDSIAGENSFMFYGEYRHSLDHKNRVLIPSKFREAVKEAYVEKFFLTRGLDKCIFVFTENDWNLMEQKLKSLPMTQGTSRSFSRICSTAAI